jgi:membrane fusion protein (multidrug efflux system)
VREGEPLGSIIPDGQLMIAAQYPADSAFGRIRAGQDGALRLDGFPWAEFGAVPARVHRVAQEVRDGRVRVELRIQADSGFRGQLQHGMPGSLEIAVERISPASLVLRMAGQLLTAAR